MNERIRLLADKAIEDMPGAWNIPDEFCKKFAELIVHQMLAITDAHTEVFQTDRDKALIKHIKQSVKTHFGVAE